MSTPLATKSYTAEAFAKALALDTLATPIVRVGMVKTDAEDSKAILFTESACDHWIKVPLASIEEITHISAAKCRDHEHPLVEIRFREPEEPAARLFAELARSVPAGVLGVDGAVAEDAVPDAVFRQSGGGPVGGTSGGLDRCKCLEWQWGYYVEYIRIGPGLRIPVLRRHMVCKTWECSPA